MAELLKLPVDSDELKVILKELPQDDKWDINVPVERGYSKAGLVRYHLEGVKALEDSYTEEVSHSKAGSVQKAAGKTLELENIKKENPLHEQLAAKMQVAESGKLALEKVHSQSQDVVLMLNQKSTADPAFKAKYTELTTLCTNLGTSVQKVRETIFKTKQVAADKVTQADLDDFCINLDNWSTLLDVARSQARKANQLLSQ